MQSQREQIQQAIESAINSGRSQNALANQLHVSAATVINIRRGDWKTISARMENKIAAYFKIEADGWPLHSTWNVKVITRLCDEARQKARFLAVIGYTGAGKTKALMYYAQHSKNAYYVLCTVITTRKTFVQSVQRAMGISEGGSISQAMSMIVAKLNSMDRPVLIIDDAGKLSHSVFRLIQIIYDQTEHRAGLVIAGTEYLKEEIERQARKNRLSFRELKRRIGYWQPLQKPSAKIVTEICSHNGISDVNAVNYIIEHAEDYGTLRNIITNAKYVAESSSRKIDRSLLNDLAIGDHAYNQFQGAKR